MCDTLQSLKEQLLETENELKATKDYSNDGEEIGWLQDLPVEILLKICSFLDAHFLKYTFSKVCQRFEDILADDSLWKYWVHNRMHGIFPPLPALKVWEEQPLEWEEVCVEMDVEKMKWTNVTESMRHIVVKDVHYAAVDTVLLLNRGELCISGGRDRGMVVWNVLDLNPHDQSDNVTSLVKTKPKHVKHDAHEGWVWDLAPDNIDAARTVYSASWDNTVKAWDLTTGLECVQAFKCNLAALSVVNVGNEIFTGLYANKILCFDVRAGPNPIYSYKAHKGPVLAIRTQNNLVASVSNDKSLAMWDRVARKFVFKDMKIPSEKAYPVCISWNPGSMYIGDSKGSIHLFHPEENVFVKSHEIWPEPPITKPPYKITSCHQGQGTMIVCSVRGDIKFLYNCSPPYVHSCIESKTFDVTQLRYLNGIMAVGTCDSAIEFWVPRERYADL